MKSLYWLLCNRSLIPAAALNLLEFSQQDYSSYYIFSIPFLSLTGLEISYLLPDMCFARLYIGY